MNGKAILSAIIAAALSLLFSGNLAAQTPPPPPAHTIAELASQIAESLQKENAYRIIFADLKGPNEEAHPIGRWLADQLASACEKDFPNLQTIIRAPADAENTPEFQKNPPKSVEDWARRAGANVVVKGTFARFPDGLGVSLNAITATEPPSPVGDATGLIPITGEMAALSPRPIPGPLNTAPRAGIGGVGVPQCTYCPPPKPTGEAKKDKFEGTVVLQVTVTPEGRAIDISIVRDPGKGMGEQAVEAVRNWKFKPALGPDGKPTAVIVPIEVTFRFF